MTADGLRLVFAAPGDWMEMLRDQPKAAQRVLAAQRFVRDRRKRGEWIPDRDGHA